MNTQGLKTILNLSKKGWLFIVLTFLLSCIPYYFIIKSEVDSSVFTMFLMWVPTFAAVILRLYYKEGLFTGNSWNFLKDWKWIFIAAFIPFIVEILTLLLTLYFDAASLKDGIISYNDGVVDIKNVALIFGNHPQYLPFFVLNYLCSYFLGALLYSLFFAFGEEYGWRGYLQNKWANNNEITGFIAIGIIWGLWHLPAVLQGHNYPDYPILGGFILMPFLCTLFAIVFGIAKNRRNVIWIAVIFHGALNISADISNTLFIESSIFRPVNDFIWTFIWLITTLIFLVYKNKK